MEKVVPHRDNLYKTFSDWGSEFRIEFSFKYIKYSQVWLNLFHFTTGENLGGPGNRIPALFIMRSGEINMWSDIDGVNGYRIYLGTYPMNLWHDVVIEQRNSIFRVWINDSEKFVKDNPTAPNTIYEIVHLYLSDPWHPSFGSYGEMANFKVSY